VEKKRKIPSEGKRGVCEENLLSTAKLESKEGSKKKRKTQKYVHWEKKKKKKKESVGGVCIEAVKI